MMKTKIDAQGVKSFPGSTGLDVEGDLTLNGESLASKLSSLQTTVEGLQGELFALQQLLNEVVAQQRVLNSSTSNMPDSDKAESVVSEQLKPVGKKKPVGK